MENGKKYLTPCFEMDVLTADAILASSNDTWVNDKELWPTEILL